MKVFAANNPNSEVRAKSSAGGVFSMLAESVLMDGGVVYGVAFDENWNVAHHRIETIDQLDTLRRSKYAFSKIGNSIKNALNDLQEGRKVLFSGVPCQVAAMRKLAGEHPDLLLVEVVCHGAPKHEYWEKYLSELCKKLKRHISDIESINFRDKRTGWKNYSFTIKFKDGKEFSQSHDDNLYMRAFLSNLTLREPCFDCKFKYPAGTQADITLGDLWGISQIAPEIDNDKGTTLVIARTDLGIRYTCLISNFNIINFNDSAKYNPAIINSAKIPNNFIVFQKRVSENGCIESFRHYVRKPLSLIFKQKIKGFIGI